MLAQLCEDARIDDPELAQPAGKLTDLGGLANADEVRRPVIDLRIRKQSAARLRKLLKEELAHDSGQQDLIRLTQTVLPKGRNFH
jgi:error-prone DNA polymerase